MKTLYNEQSGPGPVKPISESKKGGWVEADVVVIGGGLAGLAAATYLARGGCRVTLFEKAAAVGGRAASQERAGAIFNLGAHALYSKSAAVEALRELGVTYTSGSPTGIRCIRGGRNYLAPVDTTSLLRTGLLSKGEKWEAARLLLKLQLSAPQRLAGISVRDWIRREARHGEVRAFLEATSRVSTYTNAPEQLSLGHFVEQLQLLSRGKVTYVDGGWQTLVDGLKRVARDAGVAIVLEARVEAIEHASGRVTGVRLADGRLHSADAAILALSPHSAQHLLRGGEGAALRSWAESSVPVKAACLDVALRRLPQPENKVVLAIDRPLFLSTQSEFSDVTPGGGVLLYTLKYLDPGATPQAAEADKRELESWLDETQPGWRAEVIEQQYLPRMVVSNALVKAADGGNGGRPGPEVPGIESLYVAGDWVGPRGMLTSASLWSARMAARAILAGCAAQSASAMSRAA